jgi:hypothetical protein
MNTEYPISQNIPNLSQCTLQKTEIDMENPLRIIYKGNDHGLQMCIAI